MTSIKTIIRHNTRIVKNLLRRHSDITPSMLRRMSYRKMMAWYYRYIWYDKIFRIYFQKAYFFNFERKK